MPDYEWLTELDRLQRHKAMLLREQADIIARIEWRLATGLQQIDAIGHAWRLNLETKRYRAMIGQVVQPLDSGWWPDGFSRVMA